MTCVIRDSNILPIPEDIAKDLGLETGASVEVIGTTDGFNVRRVSSEMRLGGDGVWRTQVEWESIVASVSGQGRRLLPDIEPQVEALLRDREEDFALDLL